MSTTSHPPRPRRARLPAHERRELIEQAATAVFAERGYRAASMDEIARRSGVSVPVVYDHFPSKLELHRQLLERHFAELRALWRGRLAVDEDPERRVATAVDAWFEYVESHPYAWRMLFADTSGDPEVQAVHREVAAQSRSALLPLLVHELHLDPYGPSESVEMLWEAIRGVLQGLARWWYEHQHVPRQLVVDTALRTLWIGLERSMDPDAAVAAPGQRAARARASRRSR